MTTIHIKDICFVHKADRPMEGHKQVRIRERSNCSQSSKKQLGSTANSEVQIIIQAFTKHTKNSRNMSNIINKNGRNFI